MEIFYHHIYEYQKGIRNLILHSTSKSNINLVRNKLIAEEIAFLIYPLGKDKINIFFGDAECIAVIKKIGKISLADYSPEEDFILGIMLGYDRRKQCTRYLTMKENKKRKHVAINF